MFKSTNMYIQITNNNVYIYIHIFSLIFLQRCLYARRSGTPNRRRCDSATNRKQIAVDKTCCSTTHIGTLQSIGSVDYMHRRASSKNDGLLPTWIIVIPRHAMLVTHFDATSVWIQWCVIMLLQSDRALRQSWKDENCESVLLCLILLFYCV